jgi:sulfopyruvate decarboxylase subunit beta
MIPLADALGVIRAVRRDDDVVVTTMSSAKVWMDLGPSHPRDLVFVPSCMGHASSVALGIALAQPARRVIVCNGDGSMLMSLGSLVTIAAESPPNLAMVIMDNGVYEVTGGQPVPRRPDFAALARASGISQVHSFSDTAAWAAAAETVLKTTGTTVIVLDIEPAPDRPAPKSPGPAAARAVSLRQALLGGAVA